MAPRKQKGESTTGGGGKTGESSNKKTKVRDTLLVDTRPGSGPQLEKEIEEANAMNEQVKKALLGYARFDILQNCDKLQFGQWNPRRLVPSQVTALGNSFLINGVDRFNYSYAMPLVVDKSSIEDVSYMPTPHAGPNLPELKLREGLPKEFKITAAGGQHRLAALKDWYAKKKARLEECIKEQEAILSADVDTLPEGELEKMNTTHKVDRQALESILAYGGQWLVVLYDKSKITKSLALFLSRNETKHVYMELPMEGLIQVYKIISAVDKDFKDISTIAHIKGNPAKQRELLRLDYVWDMMSFFDAAGTHYWHSDIMKFKEFYKMMTSSYGGILAFLVRKLEQRLYYCFNSVQLDPYEVQEAIEAIEHDSEDIEARKQLSTIYLKLKNADPIPGAISSSMRNVFDEAFCTTILKTSAIDYFANSTSPQWVTAYAQYTDAIPNKLRELVEAMENRGDLDSDVTDIGIALRTCPIKAQIVFACDSFHRELPFFPFMTSSAFLAVAKHLSKIDSALLEFSSWWSPYVYSAKVFPREWSPGSPSADMIRAIMAHPSIMPKKRMNVCDQVISAIFNHYPAFINMVASLSRITVPPRFIKQAELLAAFGTKTVSASSKGKGKAASEESEDGEYIPNDDDDDDDDKSNSDDDDDDDEKETDANATQPKQSRDQRALLRQKNKEEYANRMNSLKREIQDAVTILASSAKGLPIPSVPLYKPWTRTSSLTSNITSNLFRGQHLIQWHTWEWASVSGPSRSRNLRILACASVVEHVIIAHYRPILLSDPKSGACFLRRLVEDFSLEYRVRVNVPTMQQSTLDNNLQVSKSGLGKVSLVWPDDIVAPHPDTSSFDLSREIARFNTDSLRSSQQTQLQKIVYHVESSRISWQDTTNTAVLRDKPPLAPDVHSSLVSLVQALNINAYLQRMAAQATTATVSEADSDMEKLMVVFRNASGGTEKELSTRARLVLRSKEEDEQLNVGKMDVDKSPETKPVPPETFRSTHPEDAKDEEEEEEESDKDKTDEELTEDESDDQKKDDGVEIVSVVLGSMGVDPGKGKGGPPKETGNLKPVAESVGSKDTIADLPKPRHTRSAPVTRSVSVNPIEKPQQPTPPTTQDTTTSNTKRQMSTSVSSTVSDRLKRDPKRARSGSENIASTDMSTGSGTTDRNDVVMSEDLA